MTECFFSKWTLSAFRIFCFALALIFFVRGEVMGQVGAVPRAISAESSPEERALFLAGIPLPAGSRLASLQESAAYQEHRKAYDETWKTFYERHFNPKRAWALHSIPSKLQATGLNPQVLFYLFGGPDIVNATAFFPELTNYILVGMEPVGEVPAIEAMSPTDIAQSLDTLRKATDTTLKFSFFITKDMKVDLTQTKMPGVLPILYTFLVRSGYRILAVAPVSLNLEGNLVASTGTGLPGVAIRFSGGVGESAKTLYYLRADLSNDGVKGHSAPLMKWMKQFGSGIGFLKAASYLLHESYFSDARDFLLSNCDAILQDDSGIPFKDFARDKWRFYLYGDYVKPIELFEKKFQPDLFNAYQQKHLINPITFGTGYNWQPGESNLLLAIRRVVLSSPSVIQAPNVYGEPAVTPRVISPVPRSVESNIPVTP
ncbi:MAG: hypothetical protein ACK5LK_11910 [Chthoniobacterales bacterium]